jgi:hypothetical protein
MAPNFAGNTNLYAYQHYELLNKIFNHLTTRSNCFAVWLTVGFFQVMDDTVRPVKLGPEMGRAENRNVRHRMFAIIDRTNMTAFQTTTTAAITANPTTPVAVNTVMATSGTNTNTNLSWTLQAGSVLTIDPDAVDGSGNPLEETVMVDSTGSNVYFTKNHASGATVVCRGNPGPWPRYDPRKDSNVVLYWTVID